MKTIAGLSSHGVSYASMHSDARTGLDGGRPLAIDRRRALAGIGGGIATLAAGCLTPADPGTPSDVPGTDVPEDALPAPSFGASEATVVVRAWTDFSCPHCRDYHEAVVPPLRDRYGDDARVRYEHRDFPIPVDDWSWRGAIAARSIQAAAGTASYWPFAAGLYENQDRMDWATVRDLASEVGGDPDVVEAETKAEHWRPVVDADRRTGRDRGVQGTPTVFLEDEQVSYADSWDAFREDLVSRIERRLSE